MKNIPLYEDRHIANLRQMLYESCELYKDNVAYLSKDESKKYQEIKYGKVLEDVKALGVALIGLGLKDKRVAIIGENRYEWSISYLAVICGVGVVVPLDKMLPEQEIKNCLKRADVSAVIYSDKLDDKIEEIKKEFGNIEYFITMKKDENVLSVEQLVQRGKELIESGDRKYEDAEIDENVMASLLFTSGTTSESKAVMLSHKNIANNIENMTKLVEFFSEDRMLSILPIHHTYECTCGFLMPIYKGSSVAYCDGLKYIASDMKEAKPTVVLAVPLIVESMYDKIWQNINKQGKTNLVKTMIKVTNALDKLGIHLKKKVFKEIHENFGGRIRLLIAGAAAINPEVSKGLRDLGLFAMQGYGLTETSPIAAVNRPVDYKDAAVGLPLPGSEVKIDNPNDEGVGEIIVKGDSVMLGYYQNEEATNEVLKDGWFYTGDLGYIDEDGFVYVSGRKKNVIITKNGKNIYPEELEGLLNESKYIKESMVYEKAKGDDKKIVAAIVVDQEVLNEESGGLSHGSLSPEEIKDLIWGEVKKVNDKLVLEKHIREIDIRDNEFEKTTTMKIKRYIEKKD